MAQAENAASTIRSFDWTYRGNPEPGNRHWSSFDGVNWTETYPSGHSDTQRVEAISHVNGCDGVITTKSATPNAKTFIPNAGCPRMVLLFRFGDEAWRPMGEMLFVRTALTGNRRQATEDELHAAYCLGWLDASAPTAAELRDPSAADVLTQGLLARIKGLHDRLSAYLDPLRPQIETAPLQAETQRAAKDVSILQAPSSVAPDKVLSDPTVQHALTCITLTWLPK